MLDYADLEISLQRSDASTHSLEFRLSLPNSDTDERRMAHAHFDLAELETLSDPATYGQTLARQLLGDPNALAAFTAARANAQDHTLRLRLAIHPNAPELHSLHWEALRDPQEDTLLFTGENLLFSRYLSSRDWRPVRPRAKGEWKALAIVANPANLSDYRLTPVDVEGEIRQISQALNGIPLDILPSDGRRATLDELINALRANNYEIIYLVAHGLLAGDQPWLFLEDTEGLADRIPGIELATRLQELVRRPRLFVLASCQSASQSGAGSLVALGPRLVEAGIPAVLAMQGKVSLKTISEFMPVFFSELQKDGQVDRAASVARGAVRSNPDFWMPVLFTRLRSGRLWHVPTFFSAGSQQEGADFDQWKSMTSFIQVGQCTPILGPGLLEPLLGSRREIARRWAKEHDYPLSPDDQDDLPRVAQYILTRYDPSYLILEFNKALRRGLIEHYHSVLPEEWLTNEIWDPETLLRALQRSADYLGEDGPNPVYRRLAELPSPIYITTNPGDTLEQALLQNNKKPQIRLCPWNSELANEARAWWFYDDVPTPEKPLVYHLFGHYKVPESLVLTEDNYLDFLIGLTENKDIVPDFVRGALADHVLLFLGFQIDDWNFRVFFRSLMTQQGSRRRIYKNHLAAQIEPEENRIQNPERARRFLKKYFAPGKVSIYWGSALDFLNDLAQRL